MVYLIYSMCECKQLFVLLNSNIPADARSVANT